MDMRVDALTIGTICNGAIDESFSRAIKDVLANIRDINTLGRQARRIRLDISFVPYEDRSGADVSFKCETKLAGSESVDSRIFIAEKDGTLKAFAVPEHPDLFEEEEMSK